jgi:translation initiation factor 1
MRLFAGTKYDRPPKCERCGRLETECSCPQSAKSRVQPGPQVVRLSIEKRKKGKVVTVIRGLTADSNDLSALLSCLKSQCGAGGTVQDNSLEVQGDHIERINAALTALGYRVRP